MTSSRLDRLFVLIETGTSPVTRKAAAQQLGEVVKYHPQELQHLLNRVFQLLSSSSWDTRIAAAQAVEAICTNTTAWYPSRKISSSERLYHLSKLTFDAFDIRSVIVNSVPLMASDNLDYNFTPEDKESVQKQVQLINKNLNMGINVDNIVSDADITVSFQSGADEMKDDKKMVSEVLNLNNEFPSHGELNRSKRKTKLVSSKSFNDESTSKGLIIDENSYNSDKKRFKIEGDDGDANKASKLGVDEELDWPFETFTAKLKMNLFSPMWEVRHGAACALREVMKIHGKMAGYTADVEKGEMEEAHYLWLEDLSFRLLCVLSLDRFGDFISDQVVAPVRETCAQCLGIVVNLLNETRVLRIVNILTYFLKEDEWEIRHGALLGIKYVLAVKKDLQDTILLEVFPLILNCFGDPIDDVSAEAASALNPVCVRVVELLPSSIPNLIEQLWKFLSSQDELGVACNSFMALLASIFMNSEAQASVSSEMIVNIIPYLWKFFNYNTSSVRKSAMQTICSMTRSKLCISRWTEMLLQNSMRHIFQRVLLEPANEIRALAEEAWCYIVQNIDVTLLRKISQQMFGIWMCLTMHPSKIPFDEAQFIFENDDVKKNEFAKSDCTELKLYMGGSETIPPEIREMNVVRIRCMAAKMLGVLVHRITHSNVNNVSEALVTCYSDIMRNYLNTNFAIQRSVAALVIDEWAQLVDDDDDIFPITLKNRMQQCLLESIYFDEVALSYMKILQDTKDYMLLLKHNNVPIDENLYNKVLRLNEIELVTNEKSFQSAIDAKLGKKVVKDLQDKRQAIHATACSISAEYESLMVTTQAIIAGASLTLKYLPIKLNPIIKPLMDAIKKEESEQLQIRAASHLAKLVHHCIDRNPSPNKKIITKLCALLCSDAEFTPQIHTQACDTRNDKDCNCEKCEGILTLINQQKSDPYLGEVENPRVGATKNHKYPSELQLRPNKDHPNVLLCEKNVLKRTGSASNSRTNNRLSLYDYSDDYHSLFQLQKINKIQRHGAIHALIKITEIEGEHLSTKIPVLWNFLYANIKDIKLPTDNGTVSIYKNNDEAAEKLISYLQVFEILCPYVHEKPLKGMKSLINTLCLILNVPYCAVRHMAARCIAELAKRDVITVMEKIPTMILPFVNAADSTIKRQGGVETIAALVDKLKMEIIPYIVLFVIPLLGRMSDQDNSVRTMASQTFGMLIQIMPLETAAPAPPNLPAHLVTTVEEQRSFLNQLLNPKCIPNFTLSVEINAELRSYQQCGVNWLQFLNKYQLHGILCDDMGLGKTLQSLCILAEDHYKREQLFKKEKRADAAALPSLVVCPPTLIGHWVYEIKKFIPNKYLNPLQYEGVPAERERLRSIALKHNLIVASYDIIRKDCDFFSSIKWNYCILDEGHIIKNGKTKISIAIKKLTANHRLILSGTPIQNNVLELWSLLDFLMPGYLGNEKQFSMKFSKPILCSRDPKSSLKEQEAGIMAMEALHQKVLPFILRRVKGDVLKDLPPKITQDYYCDLSPVQQKLYEDFSKSEIKKNTINAIKSQTCNSFSMFQALRYLQSVCNHPKLVLTREHPLYEAVTRQLDVEKSSLSDIKHAAKLVALKQLLLDCGIGGSAETDDVTKSGCIVSQHRALIFCQLKAMLNILEHDFFKVHLPNVTYLRLDGSVPSNERHKIVTSFNLDPSIDVLILTTQIGGLGLNLTGADTVIFVEHDWSPMKDLQAMDRAHRIGQKKVVNVYRLITKATLEQKIMGLQEFKLKTANTIITAENSSLATMSTEKLLDLFALDTNNDTKKEPTDADSPGKINSTNDFVKSLPGLWDTKDYEDEYDMSSFINSLRE